VQRCYICFSFWGALSPGHPTGALPLDPTRELPVPQTPYTGSLQLAKPANAPEGCQNDVLQQINAESRTLNFTPVIVVLIDRMK